MIKELLINDYDSSIRGQVEDRNHTFDLVRGFAVIFMIAVHVLGVYSSVEVYNSLFGNVVDFLGSPPAAPVFMFTMGVFFILSRKTEGFSEGVSRGLKLYLLSLVFSFFRSDFVTIIEGVYFGSMDNLQESLTTLIEVDILQFAGVAYVLLSIIRKVIKKPIGWIAIAFGIMLASPLVWGFTTGIEPVDWVLNYILGSGDETYFPIFSWLYYPLLGMAFGVIYKASDDHDALFKSLIEPSILLLAIGSAITLTNVDFHVGDYFRSGPGAVVWITGFVGVWLWFNNKYLNGFVVKADGFNKKLLNFICYMGRATTKVYLIHWILLTWTAAFIGYETQGYMGTVFLAVLFTVISYSMSKKVDFAV